MDRFMPIAPSPTLGVTPAPGGLTIALFSEHASAAYFCAFDAQETEIARVALTQSPDGVWRGFAPGLGLGARYGFRVDGPFDPGRGHRFDVSKLLADPYAAAFDRPFALHGSQFTHGQDSAPHVPKAIVVAPSDGEPGRKRVADSDLVLYELNLRGFSKLNANVPESARGRFAALGCAAVLDHLQNLGVTAVEIMPADIFVDERHLPPLGLTNAWGYNPVVYGAPDPRLAPDGWSEVRAATDALHARGMEAILDVVFNHDGESDQFGPTLSLRGLDNASYFRLPANDLAAYVNDCGTGNCLRLDHRPVVEMAMAALRRWAQWGGVDGFRFDLATACGRTNGGFDSQAPFFRALANDPILAKTRLIAEPWDVGPGGYQVGAFPDHWAEWNDRFRDGARRFWRGDAGARGEWATRLAGSHDLFKTAPSAAKSVNFVVAHDGFTLADLVSYAAKHNDANGEKNRDGSNDNHSWNHGVEGETRDPAILAARRRDQRNLIASLAFARGTPMLSMGAELGHSQAGNNNAYAQENALTWIDWANADKALVAFTARAFAARRDHAAIHSTTWLSGAPLASEGLHDVEWRDADGPLDSGARWNSGSGDVLALVLCAPSGAGFDRCFVAFNRGATAVRFRLPEPRPGMAWIGLLDTSDEEGRPSPLKLADALDAPTRSTHLLAETVSTQGAPRSNDIDALAEAAGIVSVWHDISGKRTDVGSDTKIAALKALGFPAGGAGEARDSLARLLDATSARAIPACAVQRVGRPFAVSVQVAKGAPTPGLGYRIETEDGRIVEGKAIGGSVQNLTLGDGRAINSFDAALPALPVGRHKLSLAGAQATLIVAPEAAYFPEGLANPRFGLSAQLYAQRRPAGAGRDQGIGDMTTLAALGEAAGKRGAATLAFSPVHALFPSDRARCSPYSPSDRRFVDPHYIDAFDAADVANDDFSTRALASAGLALAAREGAVDVDYEAVWRLKRPLLQARHATFKRRLAGSPTSAAAQDYAAFVAQGGQSLRRFALHQALADTPIGSDWRNWPAPLRAGEAQALAETAAANADSLDFALFLQWLADRQLARAASRSKAAGLDLGLYRDLAVGAAPDGAEAWSRQGELATGLTIGAPPDPFSAQGQNWNIPPLNPIAGAAQGWNGFGELYRANMRHAGLLRVDHAMGLTRLFVLPEGGKPSDGAYLKLPFNELLGVVTLESQRARCALVGEDLGTVPQGFRPAMAERNVLGMSVLWFERDGVGFVDPKAYPSLSVASVSTHDLATLAGWWIGADIGERLMLGLDAPDAARRALDAREAEKRALVEAIMRAGKLAQAPDPALPLHEQAAAAIHAYVAGSGALLMLAQMDDLAGETIGTNLPGTDKERANWRRRLALDVEAALAGSRGSAILSAMAARR